MSQGSPRCSDDGSWEDLGNCSSDPQEHPPIYTNGAVLPEDTAVTDDRASTSSFVRDAVASGDAAVAAGDSNDAVDAALQQPAGPSMSTHGSAELPTPPTLVTGMPGSAPTPPSGHTVTNKQPPQLTSANSAGDDSSDTAALEAAAAGQTADAAVPSKTPTEEQEEQEEEEMVAAILKPFSPFADSSTATEVSDGADADSFIEAIEPMLPGPSQALQMADGADAAGAGTTAPSAVATSAPPGITLSTAPTGAAAAQARLAPLRVAASATPAGSAGTPARSPAAAATPVDQPGSPWSYASRPGSPDAFHSTHGSRAGSGASSRAGSPAPSAAASSSAQPAAVRFSSQLYQVCSQLAGSIKIVQKEELLARLVPGTRRYEQRRRAAAAGLPTAEAAQWAAEDEAVADGVVQGREVLLAAGKEVMVFRSSRQDSRFKSAQLLAWLSSVPEVVLLEDPVPRHLLPLAGNILAAGPGLDMGITGAALGLVTALVDDTPQLARQVVQRIGSFTATTKPAIDLGTYLLQPPADAASNLDASQHDNVQLLASAVDYLRCLYQVVATPNALGMNALVEATARPQLLSVCGVLVAVVAASAGRPGLQAVASSAGEALQAILQQRYTFEDEAGQEEALVMEAPGMTASVASDDDLAALVQLVQSPTPAAMRAGVRALACVVALRGGEARKGVVQRLLGSNGSPAVLKELLARLVAVSDDGCITGTVLRLLVQMTHARSAPAVALAKSGGLQQVLQCCYHGSHSQRVRTGGMVLRLLARLHSVSGSTSADSSQLAQVMCCAEYGDLLQLLWTEQEGQGGDGGAAGGSEGSDRARAVEAFVMAARAVNSSGQWQLELLQGGVFCSRLGLQLAVAGLRRCSEEGRPAEQVLALLACVEHMAGLRLLEPEPAVELWGETVQQLAVLAEGDEVEGEVVAHVLRTCGAIFGHVCQVDELSDTQEARLMKPALQLAVQVVTADSSNTASSAASSPASGPSSPHSDTSAGGNSGNTDSYGPAVALLLQLCHLEGYRGSALLAPPLQLEHGALLCQAAVLQALCRLLSGTQVQRADGLWMGIAAAKLLHTAAYATWSDDPALITQLVPRLPRAAARQLLKAMSASSTFGNAPAEEEEPGAEADRGDVQALVDYSGHLMQVLSLTGGVKGSSSWRKVVELVLGSEPAGLTSAQAPAGAVEVACQVLQLQGRSDQGLAAGIWPQAMIMAKRCVVVAEEESGQAGRLLEALQLLTASSDVAAVPKESMQQLAKEAARCMVLGHSEGPVARQHQEAGRAELASKAGAVALRVLGRVAELALGGSGSHRGRAAAEGAAAAVRRLVALPAHRYVCAALVGSMGMPGSAHQVLCVLWVMLGLPAGPAGAPAAAGQQQAADQQARSSASRCWTDLMQLDVLGKLSEMMLQEWGPLEGDVSSSGRLRSRCSGADDGAVMMDARRWWLVMLVEVVKTESAAAGAGSEEVGALKRALFEKMLACLKHVVQQAGAGRRGADVLVGNARLLLQQLGLGYLLTV